MKLALSMWPASSLVLYTTTVVSFEEWTLRAKAQVLRIGIALALTFCSVVVDIGLGVGH